MDDSAIELIDFPALFAQAAHRWGHDREALVAYRTADLDGPRAVWSFGQLAADILGTAAMFRNMGLQSDQRIALLLPNMPEIHPLLWGGMAVAGVALINPLLQAEHVTHLIDKAGASVLCVPSHHVSPELAERGEVIARSRPNLRLVSVGPEGVYPDCLSAIGVPQDKDYGRPVSAPAALFHTGGTTGRPKIAPLSLANLLHAARLLTPVLEYAPDDRIFSPLPLFHIAGTIVGGLAPFLSGTAVVMPAPVGLRDPAIIAQFWKLLERERASMMVAVPTSLAVLCNVPLGDADLSALRYVLTGTSPLPAETARRFSAMTGKAIHTGYGMTESSGVIAYDPRSEMARSTTVGKPLPGLEVQIDPLGTEEGAVGRVLVRGPNMFAGYLDGPQHDADDWLDTGDLGFIDDDGWLTLTGRSKDIIIRGGHNIDPASIEEIAASHPEVVLAAAVGQIDEYAGEVPALYVDLAKGSDEQRVLSELADLLARGVAEPPARPKNIWALPAMPTTAVGKIYKPALRIDAARRRIVQLLADHDFTFRSVDVTNDDGGRLIVKVTLDTRDAARHDEARGLIARFPVHVQMAIAAPGAGSV